MVCYSDKRKICGGEIGLTLKFLTFHTGCMVFNKDESLPVAMKSSRQFLFIILLLLAGCYTVPETGRNTLNFMPESLLSEQAAMAFDQMKQDAPVSANPQYNERVRRVATRVLNVAVLTGNLPPVNQWEFVVFDDDATINAFAMPGGKVGVYTGLLKLAESDDELAAIIGHEIAHVSARHGNERMSQSVLLITGGLALGYAVKDEDKGTQEAVMLAYGVGTTIGAQLPFSRLHENEADEIGLLYMARAGYDPREAVRFWKKMQSMKGQAVAEFLSTHPSHQTRIARLTKLMPKAMAEYEAAKKRNG